jgi:hypothetical protein
LLLLLFLVSIRDQGLSQKLVAHAIILASQETEIRRITIPRQSRQKKFGMPHLNRKKPGTVADACHPRDSRKLKNRRTEVQASLCKSKTPISKITKKGLEVWLT